MATNAENGRKAAFLEMLGEFLDLGDVDPDRKRLLLEAAENILGDQRDAGEPLVSRARVEEAADLQISLYGDDALEMARLAEERSRSTFAKQVRVELERRKRVADRT